LLHISKIKLPILKEGFTNKVFMSHAISKLHFSSIINENNSTII